jgi:hypothetical protein
MTIVKKNDFVEFIYENNVLIMETLKPTPTDEEWEFTKETLLSFYTDAFEKKYNFSLIFNLKDFYMTDIKKIRDWGELFTTNRETNKQVLTKSVLITDNIFFRYVLNMVLSVYPTSKPIKIVASLEEALEFINSHL